MKLGPAEDGGRKLASAATPNHSDGSKDFSLCSTGNGGIKNEEKKESALICLSYFSTVFNNVLLKQNNKQQAEKEKSSAALWNKYEETSSWLTEVWMKLTLAVISSAFDIFTVEKL